MSTENLPLWMSADTAADAQLKQVIEGNSFPRKYPERREAMRALFGVDDVFATRARARARAKASRHTPKPHFGKRTLDAIDSALDRPAKCVVEVGSYLGCSARVMSKWLKSKGPGTAIICIDTWCGDINMWLHPKFRSLMDKSDGDPGLFDRFVANVMHDGSNENLIPIRVSSIVGARMIKVLNYIVDVVYIDASHEAGETFMELALYYDVLRDGGVLFGDDYHGFPAVKKDVDYFCTVTGVKLEFTGDGDTWIIRKSS